MHFLFSDTNKVPGEIVANIFGMKTNPFRARLTSVTRHFTSDNEAEEQNVKNVSFLPGIILPMVEPARLTLEMITKPKPSFSSRETLTS